MNSASRLGFIELCIVAIGTSFHQIMSFKQILKLMGGLENPAIFRFSIQHRLYDLMAMEMLNYSISKPFVFFGMFGLSGGLGLTVSIRSLISVIYISDCSPKARQGRPKFSAVLKGCMAEFEPNRMIQFCS
jgi:hypothetical protein